VLRRLNNHIKSLLPDSFFYIFAFLIFFSGLAYLDYRYLVVSLQRDEFNNQKIISDDFLSTNLENLRNKIKENNLLSSRLNEEKSRNDDYGKQVESLSSVVGDLYKLSKTDRELLQKYSNIYFLNENYIPSALSPIDIEYLYRKEKEEKIHTSIKPYLENLLKSANTNGINLKVLSAYRSFGTQASLKASYKIVYGTTAANKFSADQGYSEHQLGSTVDFTTDKIGENLNTFEKTEGFKWLENNAYLYGFILSYPKGNKFYQFEPWHFRFVGVELATKLFNEKKYFYDLDQRDINEYLIKIFN
jgi:LAS superfamily LD-carboxypeptidase LdcB